MVTCLQGMNRLACRDMTGDDMMLWGPGDTGPTGVCPAAYRLQHGGQGANQLGEGMRSKGDKNLRKRERQRRPFPRLGKIGTAHIWAGQQREQFMGTIE